MSIKHITSRILHRIADKTVWESQLSGLVLHGGEIAFVHDADGGIDSLKVGDGSTPFTSLPYVQSPLLSTKQDILVGTREHWTQLSTFVPANGQIVVWSDKGAEIVQEEGQLPKLVGIPGFKVGDGMAANVDLPFAGDEILAEITDQIQQHAYLSTHLSVGERESWNDKIALLSSKSTVSVDNTVADVNIVHISKDDYEQLVADSKVLSNFLYIVSSDYVDAHNQQVKNIAPGTDSTDAATVGMLGAKSTVSVDSAIADINIVHISKDDYEQLVVDGEALSNHLYIVSSDYVDVHNQQVKNVAPGTDSSDAATVEQVSSIVGCRLSSYVSTSRTIAGKALTADVTAVEIASAIELSSKEDISNKVTTLLSTSTDDQYPTAKCMYDIIGNIESALDAINNGGAQ